MPDLQTRDKVLLGTVEAKQQQELDNDFKEFFEMLGDRTKYSEKIEAFVRNRKKLTNVALKSLQDINEGIINKFAGREVSISVPLNILKTDEIISVDALVGNQKFSLLISCGFWKNLKPTSEETRSGQINLMDHFRDLVPRQGKYIGLFTYQNGMNNSLKDFVKMGNSIRTYLPEKPLCIGIYNDSYGFVNGATSVLAKMNGHLSDSICGTFTIMTAIAKKLEAINSELLWSHIAHSEGGMIAQTLLLLLNRTSGEKKWGEYFRTHLHAATFGAVLPIPRTHAMAVNYYSKQDLATWSRVEKYLDHIGKEKAKDYKIVLLDRIEKPEEPPPNAIVAHFGKLSSAERIAYADSIEANPFALYHFFKMIGYFCGGGDHGFLGETYKKALEDDIKEFKKQGPIYDGK